MARILVIDDEKPVRNLLRNLLEGAGHQVIEACEGDEGLRFYRTGYPDLVITDMHMPGKDGFQVIKELHGEGLPILLVEQNVRAAMEISNRGYILETGSVVMEGESKELLNDEKVIKAYMGA